MLRWPKAAECLRLSRTKTYPVVRVAGAGLALLPPGRSAIELLTLWMKRIWLRLPWEAQHGGQADSGQAG
jgi:hypothetical protein